MIVKDPQVISCFSYTKAKTRHRLPSARRGQNLKPFHGVRATVAPVGRSSTAPSRAAEIATRPARRPSSTPETLSSAQETHVVGVPSGASEPGRCQSLPPTGIADGSHACHQDSGVVHERSSHDQCQTSSSGGRLGIGCTHECGPANGWLTDISPPRDSATDSHDEAGSRKSIQPVSPSTPACPSSVVTSCPGSSVTPYLAEAGPRSP